MVGGVTLESVLRSKKLPSLPTIAVKLLNLANDPESGIGDFVAVVRNDPALVTRIIGYVNSPLLGCERAILDLDHAVSILGRSRTVTQALGFYLTDDVKIWPLKEQYEHYWLRSAVVGVATQILSEKKDLNKDIDFFMAGILLDVGQLAMLRTITESYWQIYELALTDTSCLHELEKEALGFDHADVGAAVLAAWKLPKALVNLVANHHDEESTEPSAQVSVMASYIGDYFALSQADELPKIMEFGGKAFDLSENDCKLLLCEVEGVTRDVTRTMDIDCSDLPSANELMSDAMDAVTSLMDNSVTGESVA